MPHRKSVTQCKCSKRNWQCLQAFLGLCVCVRPQLPVPIWMERSTLLWDRVCVWCGAQPPSPLRPRLHLHPTSKWILLPVPPGGCGALLRERLQNGFLTVQWCLFFKYISQDEIFTIQSLLCSFACSAIAISDPFFSSNQSSWMSFPPTRTRHRTVVQLQFQPLSADGILVYTAQHLSARAGEDIQSRFNLMSQILGSPSAECRHVRSRVTIFFVCLAMGHIIAVSSSHTLCCEDYIMLFL